MFGIDFTSGFGQVLAILLLITVIAWIFLPWIVMRIESRVIKSSDNLQDIRDTLKDILFELRTNRPTAHVEFGDGSEVDIELTEEDMWRADGLRKEA